MGIGKSGVLREYQMAVFTTAYSNFRWAKLFTKQNTQCFLEAHSDFFEYTNGSFAEVVYDNMRLAVKKFVGRNEKEPTDELLKLSLSIGLILDFAILDQVMKKVMLKEVLK